MALRGCKNHSLAQEQEQSEQDDTELGFASDEDDESGNSRRMLDEALVSLHSGGGGLADAFADRPNTGGSPTPKSR